MASQLPAILDSPLGKYRVRQLIGGSTHKGSAIVAGTEHQDDGVVIKFELIDCSSSRLEKGASIYRSLAGTAGVPFVHCSGTSWPYRFMVLDCLGPDLEALHTYCKHTFTLKTILQLADQLLSFIEDIHSQSYILCNIEPKSFAIGLGKFVNQIFGIRLHHSVRLP